MCCLHGETAGFPQGPPLIPFIGNLLSLASEDTLSNLSRLRQKYGDVYALYIGKELTVFLNGYNAISDALLKKGSLFSRRPYSPSIQVINTYPGIVSANDNLWKEQRAFTQQALKQLCFKNGSKHIEEVILGEVNKLLDKFVELDRPVNPNHYLAVSAANVISNVILSRSFDLDDGEFGDFLTKVRNNSFKLPRIITLLNCFPFLAKLPGDILNIEPLFAGIHAWSHILKKNVYDRSFDGTNSDIVELYMQRVKDNEASGINKTLTEKQMAITCYDLVIAGSDTAAITMNWLLLYILQDSKLEARLHSEIDDVIGREQPPSLENRYKMPFTEATILEVLRIAAAAPLGVPHSVPHDIMFKGFLIPKDTTVISNLNSILMDPSVWKDPEKFNPKRFLTADESAVNIPKEFIPFSLGPRSCLGESLAKMELFLYLTSILQRFRLGISGSSPPVVKGTLGVTFNPEPYKMRFIKRH